MSRYMTRRVTERDCDQILIRFIYEAGVKCSEMYGDPFPGWEKFDLRAFIRDHYLFVCYRDKNPVGFLAAKRFPSFFSEDVSILSQQLLYGIPGTRATLLLLKCFLDFGKYNANHVITGIGMCTNIKPQSLQKLGFTELETLYRWKR